MEGKEDHPKAVVRGCKRGRQKQGWHVRGESEFLITEEKVGLKYGPKWSGVLMGGRGCLKCCWKGEGGIFCCILAHYYCSSKIGSLPWPLHTPMFFFTLVAINFHCSIVEICQVIYDFCTACCCAAKYGNNSGNFWLSAQRIYRQMAWNSFFFCWILISPPSGRPPLLALVTARSH